MATLGKQIKRARVRLGIRTGKRVRQQDLAAMVGASRSAVNAWENDRSIPDDYDWAKLEEVLGTQLSLSSAPASDRVLEMIEDLDLTEDERELLIARLRGDPDPPAREPGEGRHRRDETGLAG